MVRKWLLPTVLFLVSLGLFSSNSYAEGENVKTITFLNDTRTVQLKTDKCEIESVNYVKTRR